MKEKILRLGRFAAVIALLISFSACNDSTDEPLNDLSYAKDETPSGNTAFISPQDEGLYVLCEGTFGQFNSAMDFYNTVSSVAYTDAFNTVNAMGMGGTANDMLQVDDYIFVVVSDDAMVRVLNADDMTVYKRFSIVNQNGVNRQPRHLVYNNGNVYVSCFDGTVVRINVSQMKITGVVETKGRNPEDITINGANLFVTNSGGLSYPNYDKTVSVIDIADFETVKTIEVKDNPTRIQSFGNRVYVLSMGDYSALPVLTTVSTDDFTVTDTQSVAATEMKIHGNYMYYFYKDYAQNKISLKKMNLLTKQREDFAQTPEDMKTPYKISIVGDIVFITDAADYVMGGRVYAFDLNGNLLYQFKTSVGPNTVIRKTAAAAV